MPVLALSADVVVAIASGPFANPITSEDFVPDERTIIKFLYAMAHQLPGKCGPNNILSRSAMEEGLMFVKEYCLFTYRGRFIPKPGFSKLIGMPLARFYIIFPEKMPASKLTVWCRVTPQ